MECSPPRRGAVAHPVVVLTKALLPAVRYDGGVRVRIRPCWGDRDRQAWLALQNEVWRGVTGRHRDWTAAWYGREFAGVPYSQCIWLAEVPCAPSPARVVGSVCLDRTPPHSHVASIRWLALRSESRQQGIGTALLQYAEFEAWRRGCSHTQVETLRTWTPALQFYRKAGYEELPASAGLDRVPR